MDTADPSAPFIGDIFRKTFANRATPRLPVGWGLDTPGGQFHWYLHIEDNDVWDPNPIQW